MPLLSQAQLPPIVLASASPRRKELLETIGMPFKVQVANVDEKALADATLPPDQYALALAKAKALNVAEQLPNSLVIAADTIVVLNNKILEKPEDEDDACRMLAELQNTTHTVITAVCISYQGHTITHAEQTQVQLTPMDAATIKAYVATGEPMDKAGSYAIQGIASQFIARIEGCYSNVVGLPLPTLRQLLRQHFGVVSAC